MGRVKGKVCVVTGGARGLGLAAANGRYAIGTSQLMLVIAIRDVASHVG